MKPLLCLTVALAACIVLICTPTKGQSDSCLVSKAGLDYVGLQAVTKNLKTCISWSLTPFATSDSLFPEKNATLARNYCRNPGYSKTTIWCYTNATTQEFDFCDTVTICQTVCRQTEAGQEYNGVQQTDSTGATCLSWASVNRIGADFFLYDRTLADANTYCRNVPPDTSSPTTLNTVPWCFVNVSNPALSPCSIQFCSQLNSALCRVDRLGQLYRGTVSTSVTGRSCIAWNSSAVYTSSNWPIAGETIVAAGSNCRNPNNSTVGLWCFVSSTQWEPCIVQVCEPKTSCPSNTQDYYRFRMNVTKSGCQSWSSVYSTSSSAWYSFTQLPPSSPAILSSPLFHAAHLPDASLAAAASFCRNPDNDPVGPWCPAASGGKVYCSDPCNNATCLTSLSTPNYIGKVSSTRRGVACQRWNADVPWQHSFDVTGNFPDLSVSDASNLCRNPNGDPFGPWCVKSANIADSDFWDYCSIPTCTGVTLPAPASSNNVAECLDSSFGFSYAGMKSVTGSGRTCQRWDSQTPHPHPYYMAQMFNALTVADAANYCRNPSNDTNGPWCYTTDPNVRIEYCNISQCTPFYPPAVEGILAFIAVSAVHSVLLTTIAAVIFLSQAANDHVKSWQQQKQSQSAHVVEQKIERTTVRHPIMPGPSKAATITPDGTLDRKMYRRDPQPQQQQQQPPAPSKFSHSNAVMKAMANVDEQPSSVWVIGGGGVNNGDAGLVGTLQPIREEEAHRTAAARGIDPQPPQRPAVRDTETLERRLDFDAESLESASLPKPMRGGLQLPLIQQTQHHRLSSVQHN